MQEPKIHSAIVPFLPADHWILERWEDVADDPSSDDLPCGNCGWVIYNRVNGTLWTWVETGATRVAYDNFTQEEVDRDYVLYCLRCAGQRDVFYPITREWFALTDEGLPQEPEGPSDA